MTRRRTVLLSCFVVLTLFSLFAASEWRVDSDSLLQQQNAARVESLSDVRIDAPTERRSGLRIPDIRMTDDQGRTFRLYSDLVRERSVCINFFYTQCDGSCPGTTMVIRRIRDELAEHFSPEEMVFISVSLDPETDDVEKLAGYRRVYQVSTDDALPDWVFASCSTEDLETLRRALGAYELDPVLDADRSQHAATLTFGNDRLDRWSALPAGMNREQLSMAMCRIMGNTARQRYAGVARLRVSPDRSRVSEQREPSAVNENFGA